MAVVIFLRLDDVRLDHFIVKIVAFTGTLTYAGKHRHTAVAFGDVIDELHDDHRLAHARTTKRANLAALEKRANEIDHLDAGGEHLRGRVLVIQRRRRAVNGVVNVIALVVFIRLHGALLVHGVAGHVKHAAHHAVAHRHADRLAGVGDVHAALEAFRGAHRHGAHPVVAKVLLHLERQLGGLAAHFKLHGQRVVNGR